MDLIWPDSRMSAQDKPLDSAWRMADCTGSCAPVISPSRAWGAMTVLRPRMRLISIGMWICRLPLSATVMVGFIFIGLPSVGDFACQTSQLGDERCQPVGTQLHVDSGLADFDLVYQEADEPIPLHREKVFPEALDILEGLRHILFRDAVPLVGTASLAHVGQLFRELDRLAIDRRQHLGLARLIAAGFHQFECLLPRLRQLHLELGFLLEQPLPLCLLDVPGREAGLGHQRRCAEHGAQLLDYRLLDVPGGNPLERAPAHGPLAVLLADVIGVVAPREYMTEVLSGIEGGPTRPLPE